MITNLQTLTSQSVTFLTSDTDKDAGQGFRPRRGGYCKCWRAWGCVHWPLQSCQKALKRSVSTTSGPSALTAAPLWHMRSCLALLNKDVLMGSPKHTQVPALQGQKTGASSQSKFTWRVQTVGLVKQMPIPCNRKDQTRVLLLTAAWQIVCAARPWHHRHFTSPQAFTQCNLLSACQIGLATGECLTGADAYLSMQDQWQQRVKQWWAMADCPGFTCTQLQNCSWKQEPAYATHQDSKAIQCIARES